VEKRRGRKEEGGGRRSMEAYLFLQTNRMKGMMARENITSLTQKRIPTELALLAGIDDGVIVSVPLDVLSDQLRALCGFDHFFLEVFEVFVVGFDGGANFFLGEVRRVGGGGRERGMAGGWRSGERTEVDGRVVRWRWRWREGDNGG
jgi:hypothetical protein